MRHSGGKMSGSKISTVILQVNYALAYVLRLLYMIYDLMTVLS